MNSNLGTYLNLATDQNDALVFRMFISMPSGLREGYDAEEKTLWVHGMIRVSIHVKN